jgi:hypothetical protein
MVPVVGLQVILEAAITRGVVVLVAHHAVEVGANKVVTGDVLVEVLSVLLAECVVPLASQAFRP